MFSTIQKNLLQTKKAHFGCQSELINKNNPNDAQIELFDRCDCRCISIEASVLKE
jgi:hypothetical protein